MLCVGASDGTTSLIQLDESLATCSKLDRTNANDMFDRLVGGKEDSWVGGGDLL